MAFLCVPPSLGAANAFHGLYVLLLLLPGAGLELAYGHLLSNAPELWNGAVHKVLSLWLFISCPDQVDNAK